MNRRAARKLTLDETGTFSFVAYITRDETGTRFAFAFCRAYTEGHLRHPRTCGPSSSAGHHTERNSDIMAVKIRTRYAPSPTGRMHVGNLRTALYAYLISKHENGDFILRIEDTDQERYVEGAVDIINRTMQQTGLLPDESPELGGPVGPYVQSERVKSGLYMEYARKLIDKGEAYYCFCTPERLASLRQVVDGKEISVYDKHCLHLSKEEVEANLAAGMPFVIRQNNPAEGTTTFHDELYGDITVDNSELDDMILMKSDGFPTYNFANVVDDHLMGITHVVRGNEYISSSPKYNRLYAAFGWEVPAYIHCPLITDADHKKLSKRSGYSSYEDLIEQGFLPEAVVNFIALLGWSPDSDQEIFTLQELVKEFDYRRIGKSPAVFDYTKLRWMNGEYLKAMDPDRFYTLAEPYLRKALTREGLDLRVIAELVRTRIEVFPDIAEMVDFFQELPEYEAALFENKKQKATLENSLQILQDLLPVLENAVEFTNDSLFELLSAYAAEKELKNKTVIWALRIAVSGKAVTPAGATQIMEILGREESLSRIRTAIARLS